MTVSDREDFERRVRFVQREHAAGRGFDAPGTLGRAHFYRKSYDLRLGVMMPAVILIVAVFCLKGMIHFQTGSQVYDQRVDELRRGEGLSRLGGVLMTADPITVWVSYILHQGFRG
tara:strand:+ start:458 stop:805 length:348 start_codon:yes stop_codon:yes gene_type:complete